MVLVGYAVFQVHHLIIAAGGHGGRVGFMGVGDGSDRFVTETFGHNSLLGSWRIRNLP